MPEAMIALLSNAKNVPINCIFNATSSELNKCLPCKTKSAIGAESSHKIKEVGSEMSFLSFPTAN